MENKEKVLSMLNNLNIKYELVEHAPVYTIEDTEKLDINKDGHIVKNLFLKNSNGKSHYLVVLKGEKKADLKSLKEQINSSSLSLDYLF